MKATLYRWGQAAYSTAMLKAWPCALLAITACTSNRAVDDTRARAPDTQIINAGVPYAATANEARLTNLRMLTNGGENAEAYFSADDRELVFQATRPPATPCDQIFVLDLSSGEQRRVSNGQGRTTCAYFFPSGDRILYSSTHHVSAGCPARPDMSQGYVWPLYDYDIFVAARGLSAGAPVNAETAAQGQLTSSPGYDAEATISRDGSKIVFTSVRDGDLDIYTMNSDGSDVRRLTTEPGYDGGAFFSADGSMIVYRAHHPADPQELADYRRLLAQGLVRPTKLDLYVMDADGSNRRRVTNNGAANFAPFFHPNGRQIIFSSNLADPRGRDFDLYLINIDGSGLERVTTTPDFDGFPMFSHDGRRLVFASNRGAAQRGETNLFIADWLEQPTARVSQE